MSDRLTKLLKILVAEPDDAFTHYGVAQEYAKLGDVPKAVEHFDRCLVTDPNYCYAYYHKAKTLADNDHTPEAIATLKSGIETAGRVNDGKALGELTSLLDSLT
jgi:tetratricopeptide (TPR) repeat protein